MALADTRIRNAKPQAQPYKLSDGGGMYLLVTPKGAGYRRLDYRFAGKRRTLAPGIYPSVSLANARSRREDARSLLVKDIDPSVAKKTREARRQACLREIFKVIAREWITNDWTQSTPVRPTYIV